MNSDTEIKECNLRELLDTKTLRWIFVGGKGGVGKTTTACSIACKLAEIRESVLIISTDPAHNISDAFGQKFYGTPSAVKGFTNLHAMEIDTNIESSFQFAFDTDSSISKILPEFLTSVPGIDEAVGFAEMMNSVQRMNYSTIVFDTAPTGHTLRLLGFPDLIEKAFTKFAGLKSTMAGAFQMFEKLAQIDSTEDFFSKLDHVRAITATVREFFSDPTKTTFVCVCIPEFLSVYESERLIQVLAKQNIDCSNIIVNQVLMPIGEDVDVSKKPDVLNEPMVSENVPVEVRNYVSILEHKLALVTKAYDARRKMQMKYTNTILDLYQDDYHIVCVPLQPKEVRGIESLKHFSELLLEGGDLPVLA